MLLERGRLQDYLANLLTMKRQWTYTLNKILVEIGQSWSELVDICPEMLLVKAPQVTNIREIY